MTECLTPDQFVSSGQWTSTGSGDLFWVSSGGDSGLPPAVFLHGIPTWSWLWRHVIPVTGLVTRSIALDLPGFGMSSQFRGQDLGATAIADGIEQFLDSEFGSNASVSLVTHDFGALVGAELISRSPERFRKLVVTNTSLRAVNWTGGGLLRVLTVPGLGQLSMRIARPWMLHLAMQPFVADPRARSGLRFDGYWYPFEHGFGQSLARMFQQRSLTEEDFDRWRAALHSYEGDVLVLWGGLDPAFTSADMHDVLELLPHAEFTVMEQASHFVPEELPGAVGRRIRAFIAGVPV